MRRGLGVGPDQHIVVAALQAVPSQQCACRLQRTADEGDPCAAACFATIELAFCIAGDLVTQFGYHARLIGTVAQLVEQGPFKALVLGSSPSRPTIPPLPRTSAKIRQGVGSSGKPL